MITELFTLCFDKRLRKTIFRFAIVGLLILLLTIVVLLFLLAKFFEIQSKPDGFADNLKIPENIQISYPKNDGSDKRESDWPTFPQGKTADFQLYNSFQPGLYKFDFWTGKIECGTIYLKAYEITQDYPLSVNRLPKESSIRINNDTDHILRFGTASDLTIYEGDFGKPYAARFEVWFKPETGKQEKKLIEKNYIIEGWQR
ncbi:MAG: hypothetical protein WCP85_00570 [Mariniphaga sp.]